MFQFLYFLFKKLYWALRKTRFRNSSFDFYFVISQNFLLKQNNETLWAEDEWGNFIENLIENKMSLNYPRVWAWNDAKHGSFCCCFVKFFTSIILNARTHSENGFSMLPTIFVSGSVMSHIDWKTFRINVKIGWRNPLNKKARLGLSR